MKLIKILGILIIILAGIAYATADYFIEKKLTTELSKLINTDSLTYYTSSISGLDVSIVNGSITIKGVKITPSKQALDLIESDTPNIRVLVGFTCDKIKMKNFEIKHFLQTQELIIGAFIINQPKFTYIFNKSKSSNKNTLPLNNLFSDSFTKAILKKFIIDDASINIRNANQKNPIIIVNNFDFELTNALMDTVTIKRFSPFDYDNIKFSATSSEVNIQEDFSLSTDKIKFNAKKNITSIDNFKLTPNYSQEHYSKKHPVQKQWVAITLDTFKISNIDFEKLIQHGNYQISKVSLIRANVGLYKDKSRPEPPFKKQPLPATAIKSIPLDLSIDTIEVLNSRIVINEKSKMSGQVSFLSFDELNASVHGFSNDSVQIASNNFLSIKAHTKIMNSAQVNFEAQFDLLSKNDAHTVKASVGPSDIKIYNKVLEPMMLVVAKSGQIHALNYAYSANDTEAIGTIDFEYENVKIEILDKEEQMKKQGLMSLAANTVIKSNNKKENVKSYTQGVIKMDRTQNKNVFPYLWHSVQSGIIYTMAPAFSEVKKEEKKANKKGWFKKK